MTTPMRPRFFYLAALCLAAMALAPLTHAQEAAPPESELAAPGSDLPQIDMPAIPGQAQGTGAGTPVFESSTTVSTAGSVGGDMGADGGAGRSNNAVDPCPAPQDAASSAPDDLAKVQEDIDRFTLCVERAQLLERYNDSVLKNEGSTDKALGYGEAMPGMAGPQINPNAPGLMPLSASALAGADVSPMPVAPSATTDGATNTVGTTGASTPAPEASEAAEEKKWMIGQVFGSTQDMQATLISPAGDEVRVRAGTRLPEEGGVVARITASQVSIRKGEVTHLLEWARQ